MVSGLDLDRLATLRSEAHPELAAAEDALVKCAAAIAEYTDTSIFVPKRSEDGEEVPPEWFGMNPDYGEDSAEVIGSSVEEEGEAEDGGKAELNHARRDSAVCSAVARIRRRSSPRGCQREVQTSKSNLMARGVAFDLLQLAKRIGPQCEATEYEDLSGEEGLTLDCVVDDDRRSHRAYR